MLPSNVTIIHIAKALDITPAQVMELAANPRLAYSKPKWEPHNGKMRLITKPRKKWKKPYQHLGTFFRRKLPPHFASHGSVPSHSPFTAGAVHCGLRHLLCLDVKDAFPSVKSDR